MAVSLRSVAKISIGKLSFRLVEEFHQTDGNGIGLFARGAPGNPDPNGILGRPILNQRWEYHPLQFIENRRFPKECRDGDKTVLA